MTEKSEDYDDAALDSGESLEPTIQVLKTAIAAARRIAPALRFSTSNRSHLAAVALYHSLIEYSADMLRLCDGEGSISVPIIARSVLDGFVDIQNLMSNPDYLENLMMKHDREASKMLKEAGEGNRFLKLIADDETFQKMGNSYEASISERKAAGHHKLQAKDAYDKAGWSAEYGALYNFLSGDAHNDIVAVLTRHFEMHEGRPKLRDVCRPRFVEPSVSQAAECIVIASELLLRRFGHGTASIAEASTAVRARRDAIIAARGFRAERKGISDA
jgi:hypothetical protein